MHACMHACVDIKCVVDLCVMSSLVVVVVGTNNNNIGHCRCARFLLCLIASISLYTTLVILILNTSS